MADVMYDSVLYNMRLAEKRSHILKKYNLEPKQYALATIHRAENTDVHEKLRSIFHALECIAKDGLPVLVPLHPQTRKHMESSSASLNSVQLIDPVSYLDMLVLEKQAKVIITDSGGVQKEAYLSEVPCITLRKETEWPETVESGWNVLVGSEANHLMNAAQDVQPGSSLHNVYGKGRAAEQIVLLTSSVNIVDIQSDRHLESTSFANKL